jgi:hypothetical protein
LRHHNGVKGLILYVQAVDAKINLLTLDRDQTLSLFPKFDQGIMTRGPANFGLVEKFDFLQSMPFLAAIPDLITLELANNSKIRNYRFRDIVLSKSNFSWF